MYQHRGSVFLAVWAAELLLASSQRSASHLLSTLSKNWSYFVLFYSIQSSILFVPHRHWLLLKSSILQNINNQALNKPDKTIVNITISIDTFCSLSHPFLLYFAPMFLPFLWFFFAECLSLARCLSVWRSRAGGRRSESSKGLVWQVSAVRVQGRSCQHTHTDTHARANITFSAATAHFLPAKENLWHTANNNYYSKKDQFDTNNDKQSLHTVREACDMHTKAMVFKDDYSKIGLPHLPRIFL